MANPTPAPPAAPSETPHGQDPVAQTIALIQPWIDYVPPQQRRLGIFIFLALMVHISTFFFISIDTTRAELRHQTRPHVTVENTQLGAQMGQTPGDDFWDQLNDPRLFLLPRSSAMGADAANLDISFSQVGTKLSTAELPPTAPPEGFQFVHPVNPPLDQRVGEAMNPSRQTFSYDQTPPTMATNTMWQWDSALGARNPAGLPDLPSPNSDTDLHPTQLRIAVTPGGAVDHVLVEQSCGKADFDQQAAQAARRIRFRSSDESGLTWGRMTVFWHYSTKVREEVVPTPTATP